jgi:hypothetical protein
MLLTCKLTCELLCEVTSRRCRPHKVFVTSRLNNLKLLNLISPALVLNLSNQATSSELTHVPQFGRQLLSPYALPSTGSIKSIEPEIATNSRTLRSRRAPRTATRTWRKRRRTRRRPICSGVAGSQVRLFSDASFRSSVLTSRCLGGIDPLMHKYNASIGYDKALYREDILGSIAFARANSSLLETNSRRLSVACLM